MGGKIFVIISGVIVLLIGLFMFYFYLKIIFNNKCYKAEIIDMNFGASYRQGIPFHSFKVSFKHNNEIICASTLNTIMGFSLFEKRQFRRYQKKYIGRRVYVYYNPNNPAQTLIKEYVWKDFLLSNFLICLSIFLIAAGCLIAK